MFFCVCSDSLDNNYVLSHYKTELCKKPPRLCRQGYACPYYHNSKDRRRSPHKHKYRCSFFISCEKLHVDLLKMFYSLDSFVTFSSLELCPVRWLNRARSGGTPASVRERRDVSIVTREQSSSSTQRFVLSHQSLSESWGFCLYLTVRANIRKQGSVWLGTSTCHGKTTVLGK